MVKCFLLLFLFIVAVVGEWDSNIVYTQIAAQTTTTKVAVQFSQHSTKPVSCKVCEPILCWITASFSLPSVIANTTYLFPPSSNLDPNHQYYSECKIGTISYSMNVLTRPQAPGFSVVSYEAVSVTLFVDSPAPIVRYCINTVPMRCVEQTGKIYTFNNLMSAQTYTLYVAAKNNIGYSNNNNNISIATILDWRNKPSRITVVTDDVDNFVISWSNPLPLGDQFLRYEVCVSNQICKNETSKDVTTVAFSGLVGNFKYTPTVTVKSIQYQSTEKGSDTFTKPSKAIISQQPPIGTSVTVQWTETSNNPSKLLYFGCSAAGACFPLPITSPFSFTLEKLNSAYIYYINTFSWDSWKTTSSDYFTVITAPATVANVIATSPSDSQIQIAWSNVIGGDFPIRYVACLNTTCQTTPLSNTLFNSLIPNSPYYITVFSFNGFYYSQPSQAKGIVTRPQNPSGLTVTARNYTSISLAWTPVRALAYRLCATVTNQCINITQPQITIPNLAPSTGSMFVLTSYNLALELSISTDSVFASTLPIAPQNITKTKATESSISFVWAPPPTLGNLNSYWYDLCVLNTSICFIGIPVNAFTVTGLSPEQTYTFSLLARNNANDSSPAIFTSANTTTIPFRGLKVIDKTSTSISVTWQPQLQSNYSICIVEGPCAAKNPQNFTSLLPNTGYRFNLTEISNTSKIQWGVIVDATLPPTPSNFRIIEVGATSLQVAWDPFYVGNILIIDISVCVENRNDMCFRTTNPKITNGTLRGVPASTRLPLVLQVTNALGDRSAPTNLTAATVPDDPFNLVAQNVSSSSMDFQWEHQSYSEIHTYVICISGIASCRNTTQKFISWNNLKSNTFYTISVKAVDKLGKFSLSAASLNQTTRTNAITQLQVKQKTHESLQLSWSPPVNNGQLPIFYRICYLSICVEGSTTSVTLESLYSSTEYTISVETVGSLDDGANPIQFISTKTLPLPVTSLKVIEVYANSMLLQWQYVVGFRIDNFSICVNNHSSTCYLVSSAASSYLVTNLKEGTIYTFSIAAISYPDYSLNTTTTMFTTIIPPETITINAISDFAAIYWTPTNPLLASSVTYSISITNLNDENWHKEAVTTQTNMLLFNLPSESDFVFFITASLSYDIFNMTSATKIAQFSTVQGSIPNAAPEILIITSNTDSLEIQINPIPDSMNGDSVILYYWLEVSPMDFPTNSTNDLTSETLQNSNQQYNITVLSVGREGGAVTVNSLQPGQTYYLRTRSQNRLGLSDYSNVMTVSTASDNTELIIILSTVIPGVVLALIILLIIILIVIIIVSVTIFCLFKNKILIKKHLDITTNLVNIELDATFRIKHSDLNFENSRILGSGAQGTVCTALYKGATVAVKVFPKSSMGIDSNLDDFYAELEFLSKHSNHSNIIRLIGAAEDPHTNSVCLITECCLGGNLASFIEKNSIPFDQKLKLLRDVASGMYYLHSHHIIHRDLKCENVLLDQSGTVAKIIDFGLSKQMEQANKTLNMTMNVGTATYLAPEVIKLNMASSFSHNPQLSHQPSTSQISFVPSQLTSAASLKTNYDTKIDVYSFAIIMYVVYFETKNPYGNNVTDLQVMYQVSQNESFRPKIDSQKVKPEENWFIELMKSCWQVHPQERPSFEQIIKIIDSRGAK